MPFLWRSELFGSDVIEVARILPVTDSKHRFPAKIEPHKKSFISSMKRHHASDARDDARRSPDAKRQRYDRGYNSNYDAQRRFSSNDSYAHRTDRYAPPPRHTDAAPDRNAESERRDAQEPSYARASTNSSNSNQLRPNNSNTGSGPVTNVRLLADAKETDPHRLAQRQKQIDYGKNTVGYDLYCAAVPRYVQQLVVRHLRPRNAQFTHVCCVCRQLHKLQPYAPPWPAPDDARQDAECEQEVIRWHGAQVASSAAHVRPARAPE